MTLSEAPAVSEPPAVVFCGHGTRHADGAAQFTAVVEHARALLPGWRVRHGFLELSAPLLPEALEALAQEGQRRIVVVPCMLFAAGHAKGDIPALLRAFAARHPEIELVYGRTFGVDGALLEAAVDRINAAIDAAADIADHADRAVPRERSLLLVIGRGSSDADANADLVKIMRLLWERLGFGWGEVGYFDVTFPHLEPAIDHAARLGYRRIVVAPYLLFTGVLLRRLQATLAQARRRHPDLEFIEVGTLNDHPGVVEVFAARAWGALQAGGPAFDHHHDHHDHDHHDHDDHGHHHDDDHHDHHHCHHDDHHHHGSAYPLAEHVNGPNSPGRWPAGDAVHREPSANSSQANSSQASPS